MHSNNEKQGQAGKPKKIRFGLESAKLILEQFPMSLIRAHSVANLHRWKAQGSWNSASDEWMTLLTSGSDADIIEVMTGEDENSIRLRSSSPYPGMLDQAVVHQLKKEIFGIDLSIFDETREEWLRRDAEFEANLRRTRG
jgi:hypothetical protein